MSLGAWRTYTQRSTCTQRWLRVGAGSGGAAHAGAARHVRVVEQGDASIQGVVRPFRNPALQLPAPALHPRLPLVEHEAGVLVGAEEAVAVEQEEARHHGSDGGLLVVGVDELDHAVEPQLDCNLGSSRAASGSTRGTTTCTSTSTSTSAASASATPATPDAHHVLRTRVDALEALHDLGVLAEAVLGRDLGGIVRAVCVCVCVCVCGRGGARGAGRSGARQAGNL